MRIRLLPLALAAFTLPGIALAQPSPSRAFDGQFTREGITLHYQDATGGGGPPPPPRPRGGRGGRVAPPPPPRP
ncbi:hypothetical protein I5U73_07060 [Stenotrophomonas maltophilia]|nr:hypothetical protein [Stenotrophomonas maltophilia]